MFGGNLFGMELPWEEHWWYYLPLVLWRGYGSLSVRSIAIPKVKRGIAMLSVGKFPCQRKQTRGNEFIPCSNDVCHNVKRFCSFKIILIWLKSAYKHNVTRSHHSGKESTRRSELPLWSYQWRSLPFISHADDVKHEMRVNTPRLLTNQKYEYALSIGWIYSSNLKLQML